MKERAQESKKRERKKDSKRKQWMDGVAAYRKEGKQSQRISRKINVIINVRAQVILKPVG